jgi:hypothetical protein
VRRDSETYASVVDVRWGARHDSVMVAGTNGYEMPKLDRQVLPGAQGYGVGRGQLGQYHQMQQGEKRRGDDASGLWRYLWDKPRRMSGGRPGARWMMDG